ncbi:hypothetical protein L3Q82_012265 [Scortum barcoo]|uniref:Uncharacterized protein n=1 Tax=Scortum barcoo TaxID=214431 RepID=A0ACB8W4K3_9TELE|nr:hypothetical protein L3Q82_012265 [Scortum barcoo]
MKGLGSRIAKTSLSGLTLYPVGRLASPWEERMKFFEPWGRQRLSFLLEKAASREAKMWRVYVPKKPSSQDTDISPAQRDEAVRWLTELHSRLQLYPETLVLAVSILDRFLAPIKARPKYLRCIAIACFFLAAKTCEEDEELATSSSVKCVCVVQLWLFSIRDPEDGENHSGQTELGSAHCHRSGLPAHRTCFHSMVLSCRSGFLDSMLGLNRSQHLTLLTRRLYHCLADHTLLQLRGSMLALALITLELETCCPDWLALTIDLLRKAEIDSSELIRSRELVEHSLSTLRAPLHPNTVYIYQPVQSQTTLQPPVQDSSLPCSTLGTITSTTESSRDHALVPTQPQTPTGGDGSIPALLSPLKHLHHLNHLQKVTLRCKASAKRKLPGPHPGARPGVGARRKRAPGGRVFAHGTRPGSALAEMVATWARLPVGSPPCRKVHEGRCNVVWVAVVAGEPRRPNPWNKTLAIGTWNVTSLGGKEPELVREVERYRLEIVGLTSTHSLGSGTQLLERGWTLHYSGVAQGERRRAGVGLLIAPQLSRHVLEFTPVNERVASLRLRVGDRSLAIVCAYGPNSSTEYRPSWSPWEGIRGVHQCTWHQDTLGRRSMIDFVVVSSDLRPYVLDTRVKRGAELSTDHHLVVSWIRWQRRKLDRPGRPKRIVRVCWERIWPSPLSGRSSTPTSGRASHRFRGRLETLSPSGPCSLPPLSTLAVRSCGRKVSGACRGGNPSNPVVVDTGSTWQAKQAAARTVLEAKTRVWEEFGEAMEEDYRSASKRFWQTVRRLRRGKQYSANTVYSAGGELLTSTGGHCRTVEEILRGSPQSHRLAFQ